MKKIAFLLLFGLTINSCSVSYQFNGASVDYNIVKTISIQDFPNHAQLVYPTLSASFSDALRNKFIRQTRLRIVDNNADLELEGEITGYEIKGIAAKADQFDSMTELIVTVRVRYINNQNPDDDLQQSFTSNRQFDNSMGSLDQMENELVTDIIEDLVDQIYNATLGNW